MLIGYNSKLYIKDFIEDLKKFADNNNTEIKVECKDSINDIYVVFDGKGVVCTVELWDITNYDNNIYQELKIKYTTTSKLLSLLIESDNVKLISKGDNYITFILIDDIITNVE